MNNGAGAETISANVALGGNQTWTINNTSSTPFSVNGTISGGHSLTVAGAGELVLGGSNTWTGGLTINGGIVQLTSTNALNSAIPQSVAFGPSSTGDLQLNGNSVTIGTLSSNILMGTPVVENASVTAATLKINQDSSATFGGVIQDGAGGGALSLVKSGSSSLTLTGINTYTGPTTVNNGRLLVNGSLSSGGVTVAATPDSRTAVLGGSGTINGLVTISSPTNVSRQNIITGGDIGTIGTLTLTNGLTIGSGGIAYFDIASTSSGDFINVTGGTLNVSAGDAILRVSTSLAVGTYNLIGYTGATPVLSNFVLQDYSGNLINIPTYSLAEQSGTLELVVGSAVTGVPTIIISSPAAGSRVMASTTINVNGVVGNTTGGATLNGNLTNGGGSLTATGFGPSNPISVVAGGTANFTASVNTGVATGTQTLIVNVHDNSATPTTASGSNSLDVVANRVVTATTVNFGSFHLGASSSGTTTLNSPGADNANTRVTVADGGVDSGSNGIAVSGGNPNQVFNGINTTDTRTVSGSFSSIGSKSGPVILTTGSEGLAGESPINVNVNYTAQVYSGKASWNLSTGGSWVTGANWGDTLAPDLGGAGAPGVDGALSIGDTATFSDVSGQGVNTIVSLNGVNPTLAGINFNAANTSYTIAPGTGGAITLQGTE